MGRLCQWAVGVGRVYLLRPFAHEKIKEGRCGETKLLAGKMSRMRHPAQSQQP